MKDSGSRLLRWRIKLDEYDYEVVYLRGAEHKRGPLSRISSLTGEKEAPEKKPGHEKYI